MKRFFHDYSMVHKVIALTILVQVSLILFWTSREGSLYWDVYYTLQNAHYISASTEGNHYVVYDSDFIEGDWLPMDYVIDMMIVERDESLLADSFGYFTKTLVMKPYYSILNILEAIMSPGEFSKWPAIAMNIAFFLLIQMVLWKLVYRLCHNETIAMLTLLLYGFSGMAFSMAVYARFYVFSTLLLVLYTYIHVVLWDMQNRDWLKCLVLEILSLIIAYWSVETSQLTLFYYVILFSVYNIFLLIKKRFFMCALYVVPIGVFGGIYLSDGYIYLITHTAEAFASGQYHGPVVWVLDSILTLTPVSFIERLAHMFLLIGRYAFGCWPCLLFFCFIFVLFIIRKRGISFFSTAIEWIVFISVSVFILVAAGLRFYTETRYSAYAFPLIAWITSTVLYSLVNKGTNSGTEMRGLYRVTSGAIVGCIVLFTVSGIRVEYTFTEDRPVLEELAEQDAEYVIIMQQDQFNVDAEIIYAVSANIDNGSSIMAIKAKDLRQMKEELPDRFLLASRVEGEMVDELSGIGYDTIWNGSTYCDYYYLMERK